MLSLSITKTNFECEDSIKYLGVVIHKNLTWNEHIESLIAKVNHIIGLLTRIKHLLPLHARVALYNALYNTIWGDRYNITLMHDLLGWPTLLQERLVHRYIAIFKYSTDL